MILKESLPEKEIIARVEAALYSSGRPMSIEELVKATGLNSKEKIKKISMLNDLIKRKYGKHAVINKHIKEQK